jgi:hypothetical protein
MAINSKRAGTVAAVLLACFGSIATNVHAQQVFAYPNAGQSQEQQGKDRYECHQWAVSQTGFDPTAAAPVAAAPPPGGGYADVPPPPPPKQGGFLGLGDGGFFKGGGVVGDAATGAALGAAGGAIAGNAASGAAIGAVASTLFGAVSRTGSNNQQAQQQQQYQQQQAYQQQQVQAQQSQAWEMRARQTTDYNNAFAACMRARKYTVN